MMIQILIPSGRTRLATLSQPLGRKGKHTCFSKADAKVQLFFHICKYFTKKHAFLYNFAQILPLIDYKHRQDRDKKSKFMPKQEIGIRRQQNADIA